MKKDVTRSIKKIEALQKRLNQRLEEKIISIEKNSQQTLEDVKNSVYKKIESYNFDISSEVEKKTKKSENDFLEKNNYINKSIGKIKSIFVRLTGKMEKSKGKQ